MGKLWVSTIAIVLGYRVSCQEIKGVILDEETKEPIPFAHVVIGNVISLSNLDGAFTLVPDGSESDLQISYMGYEPVSIPFARLQDYNVIHLIPSVFQLEDVVVQTGDKIIENAYNRFHLNYEVAGFQLTGFYKETLGGADSLFYLAEGILNIYVPSNVSTGQALVHPIKTRKKVFKRLDNKTMLLKGNASDMSMSSIWREDSFLRKKNRVHYDFFYTGVSRMNGKEVLVVEFEPKNSKGYVSGKIFLDEKSLAIIKMEYRPEATDDQGWQNVVWTEEFVEKNGIYELFRVSYDGEWYQKNKVFRYQTLLVVNESKSTFKIPEDQYLLGQDDTFFQEAEEDFSDSFWSGYNYIKLDLESKSLLNKQGIDANF